MTHKEQWLYQQSGVIPYRIESGALQVLLITSRGGKKWVIPKGLIEDGLTAQESAAKEALEEAGIEGDVEQRSIGHYTYRKWGGLCNVEVFPMKVNQVHRKWLEQFRERRWQSIDDAVKRINQNDLNNLLLAFQKSLSDRGELDG